MSSHHDSNIAALPDELLMELLETFAHLRSWTELEHHHQVAAEIIHQHLTVQFHAFVRQQISY